MIKNFSMAFRSLFKKGRNNGIKIIALAVGLAMGLVLIAKVCFERSYDNFYPDNDRIYLVRHQPRRKKRYLGTGERRNRPRHESGDTRSGGSHPLHPYRFAGRTDNDARKTVLHGNPFADRYQLFRCFPASDTYR